MSGLLLSAWDSCCCHQLCSTREDTSDRAAIPHRVVEQPLLLSSFLFRSNKSQGILYWRIR
uniref:Uncharacterized protein n=1 Tax=Arundo donax TaxID=35708 RepID=A0A0A8YC92_ARUDO